MKLFIWENVEHLTTSYHDGGGCCVVAAGLVEARELLAEEVPVNCSAMAVAPDYTTDVPDQSKRIFIFPDAGCC